MDTNSLFEYLVPALFFVFYIITKILEVRAKKSTPQDMPEESEPSAVDEIRREIQKKILERQSNKRHTLEAEWAQEPKMQIPQSKPRTTSQQNDYLLRLKKEQERLEASRQEVKKARALQKQTKRAHTKATPAHSLRGTLHTPSLARNAYIYHEIFGAPIALRKKEGMLPSWKL